MPKRETIHIPGVGHKAPIPGGAKIANIVFSSAISGQDPESNEYSQDPEQQAKCLFRNIQAFTEQAGGSPENIGHMTVYLRDENYRKQINSEWVKMFPDENNRPARHAITLNLRGQMMFQVEIIMVL